MNSDIILKASNIIKKETEERNIGFCTLALIDEDGFPTASTITIAKENGIKELMFCTGLSGNKGKRIQNGNKASVCINTNEFNITLVGTIEIMTDTQTKQDAWYSGMEYHFTGADDPEYCVLKFTTKRYNLFIGGEEVGGKL